jgi:hypothetical protein
MVEKNPIRVVPLFEEHPVPKAGAPPKLTYRNGPLIQSVKIFTVFWGSAWKNKPELQTLSQKLNTFFQYIVTSPLIDELAEYNVTGHTISHGAYIGTANVASPAPRTSVKDASIQTLLKKQIAAGTLPAATPDTLYFVFTPPGTTIVDGTDKSCGSFCGYHNTSGNSIFYAAMPYPGCHGCLANMVDFDALTGTVSHELCEAITDPVPGTGWYDDNYGEIGDICAWKFKKLGGFNVQLEWSDKSNSCI